MTAARWFATLRKWRAFPRSVVLTGGVSTMSNRMTLCGVLVLAGLLAVSLGCPGGKSRIHPPGISSSAGADAVAAFDTDKDGKIDGAE